MESAVGGWYNSRRQYRSVAFGTWQVGGARLMTSRQNLVPTVSSWILDLLAFEIGFLECQHDLQKLILNQNQQLAVIRLLSTRMAVVLLFYLIVDEGTTSNGDLQEELPANKKKKGHLDRNSRRMGESSPNLCRLHPTDTQRSLGILPTFSVDQRLCIAGSQDCYSSSEYVAYQEQKDADTGNAASEPIQAAFRADLNSQRRGRIETSLQRAHYRSASAGADAAYSVRSSASTSDMKNPLALSRDNARFLRATKKFFKKIYTSATLPSKTKQQQQLQQQHQTFAEPVRKFDPVNDITIRMVDDEEEEEEDRTSRIDDGGESPLDATDSGLDMDRSSTPDASLESGTMTSKSDTSSHISQDPLYTDLFENLRREMMLLRQRDAKILAELHRAEEHILRTARGRTTDRSFPC